MNQITQKEIFEKYPKIFKDKDLPMTETCMCWGLEVPDSWLPIIERLCFAMQNCAWVGPNTPKGMQVVAEQVKSKFNQLRFYYRIECGKPFEELTEENKKALEARRKEVDGMILLAECMIEYLQ